MSATLEATRKTAADQAAESAYRKQIQMRQAGLEYALKVPGIYPDNVLSMAKDIADYLAGKPDEGIPGA